MQTDKEVTSIIPLSKTHTRTYTVDDVKRHDGHDG